MKAYVGILCIYILHLGCVSSLNNDIDSESFERVWVKDYPSGELECEYVLNAENQKDGIGRCYYTNGQLKEISMWSNDTIVYENIQYALSGQISRYNFYNAWGELVYSRMYDEKGGIKEILGDPFIQVQLNSHELMAGDTLVYDIYVADPPGCSHAIWGIHKNQRFQLDLHKEDRYIYRGKLSRPNSGYFILTFEIDFVDSIVSTRASIPGDFSFKVLPSLARSAPPARNTE